MRGVASISAAHTGAAYSAMHHVGEEAANPGIRPPNIWQQSAQGIRRSLYPRGYLLKVKYEAPLTI